MKTLLQNKLAVRIAAAVLALILAGGVAAGLIIRHQNKVFFSEAETKKRAAKCGHLQGRGVWRFADRRA